MDSILRAIDAKRMEKKSIEKTNLNFTILRNGNVCAVAITQVKSDTT